MATIEQVGIELNSTQAATAAKQFEQAMERAARSTGVLDKELTGTEARLKRSGSTTSILAREMRLATQSILAQSAETAKLTARLAAMEPALIRNASAMERVGASSRRTVASVAQVGASTARSAAGFAALTGPLTRMAALFGGGLGLRAAVTSLSSFERTLATVGAVAGASGAQMQRLRDRAADLGATTEFTASEAGEGLLFLARAGFSAEEAISALPRTLDLATAGALGLGEAADIASNVLSQFRLEVSELARVNDALVTVSNSANTDIRQLAEALNYAGPVAGSLGIQIEEVAASIGVLGDSGIQASLAGTNIRGILAALASSTPDARKALSDLRVDMTRLDPATNSVVDILRELERANLDAATAFDVFGRRNAAAILTLTSGVDKIDELIQKQREAAGATEAQAAAIRDTLAGSINTLKSTLEAAVLATGDDGLTGGLRDIVDGATETVRKLFDLESRTDEFGATTDIAATAIEAFALALALQGSASFLRFIGGAAAGLGSLTKSLYAAVTAQRALNVATAINPWAAVATAIAGAAFAIRALSRDTDEATLAIERNNKARDRAIAAAQQSASQSANDPLGDSIEAQTARLENRIEDLRRIQSEVQDLGTGTGQFDRVFASGTEVAQNLERQSVILEEIKQRENRVRGLLAAGIPVGQPDPSFRDVLGEELKALQSEFAAAFTVDGQKFVPLDIYEARLKSLGVATEQIEGLADRAASALGDRLQGRFAAVGDVALVVKDRVAQLGKELETLGKDASEALALSEGQKTDLAIAAFERGPQGQQSEQLLERIDLLEKVRQGTLSLDQAEAILADHREIASRVEAERKRLAQDGIAITEDAERAIREEIAAIVAQERAVQDATDSLRRQQEAKRSATDAADALAQSMQAEIDALNGLSAGGSAVEQVLSRINAVFGEGSETAKNYAEQLGKLAEALDKARDADGGGTVLGAGPPRDGFADARSRLDREIQFYESDRDGRARILAEDELIRSGVTNPTQAQTDEIRIRQERAEELAQREQDIQRASTAFADAIGNAVTAFATGSGDLRDIATSLLQDLQATAVEAFISEPLKRALRDAISGILSSASANGNVFDRGGIQAFANGGIVGSPTLFGYGGGRLGLMGEAGPEAILPLERGSGGKLGVRGGQQITYAPRFTVTVAAGADVAGVRDAMKKSSRMMSRDFQRRARGLN